MELENPFLNDVENIRKGLEILLERLDAKKITAEDINNFYEFFSLVKLGGKELVGIKRNVKDSIFCDLFSELEYLWELFRVLHPEADDVTIADLQLLTIGRILTTGRYNDLGFLVQKRLIILVEAQSTWTVNVLFRCLSYIAKTYDRYISEHSLNVYGTNRLDMPKVELYILYTGKKLDVPSEISLQKEFHHEGGAVDVTAKVLVLGENNTIVDQYIQAAKIIDDYTLGVTNPKEQAERLAAALDECISKGLLKEYLIKKKPEVLEMLAQFYNEANYIEAARRSDYNEGWAAGKDVGWAEGKNIGRIETTRDAVLKMFNMNMPANDIAKVFSISVDQVLAIKTANRHL